MTYEPTEYLAGGSVSDYEDNPNADIYKINSKAEEVQSERTSFNNKFITISGNGYRSLSNKFTTGNSNVYNSRLTYWTKDYGSGLESRLITTDRNQDVETHPTGKYLGANPNDSVDYAMTARTNLRMLDSGKQLVFPFDDIENGYIIWTPEDKQKMEARLEYLRHINLGLVERPKTDFAVNVQLKSAGITIKDKEKIVNYNILEDDYQFDASDKVNEYVKQEISASDYNWRVDSEDIYPEATPEGLGYALVEDELNIYVMYKINIRNQSTVSGKITELVDYYDQSLNYICDENYKTAALELFRNQGFDVPSTSWATIGNDTIVDELQWQSTGLVNGYKSMTTNSLSNIELEPGSNSQDISVFVIFRVDKTEHNETSITNKYGKEINRSARSLYIDEFTITNPDDGIRNVAEIGAFETEIGVVDKDSAPKNATPGNKNTYEDDTDDAPFFKLELSWEGKHIQGTVWDDLNENGSIDANEPRVKNVTVRLYERFYDEYGYYKGEIERPPLEIGAGYITTVSDQIRTKNDGSYDMVVEGGNYRIEFVYGNTEMLYYKDDQSITNKKYNAQDYMATQPYTDVRTYYADANAKADRVIRDVDVDENGTTNEKEKYPETLSTHITSNARDRADLRAEVIKSAMDITNDKANLLRELTETNGITYLTGDWISISRGAVNLKDIAEELSGHNDVNDEDEDEDGPNYTYMESLAEELRISVDDIIDTPRVVNLGLKERPKASIDLDKEVTRIVLKSNDGTALIDTDDASKQANLAKDPVTDLQTTLMYLDASATEGATIDIYYNLIVTNKGEEDSLRNYIYVPGLEEEEQAMENLAAFLRSEFETDQITVDGLLPIRARTIYDYVNINLEYRADDNLDSNGIPNWDKVYDEDDEVDSIPYDPYPWITQDVRLRLPKSVRKISKVLKTGDRAVTSTKEGDLTTTFQQVTIPIHLGISLSEDTGAEIDNEAVYQNAAEIVQVYTAAGRRDYNTIPGNDVPYNEDVQHEDDYTITGTSTIVPPTGQDRIYYVLAIISATIIIVGIVLIKKKVLRK